MKLAIDGGPAARERAFPGWPQYDQSEETALLRSLRQGQWWRAHGSENVAFEQEFATYHGCEHAVSVANGTVALEIALLAMGIGPGDEVIVPAYTFISTSMAVQRVGGVAIPVDVLPDTFCMDPQATARCITSRTRAIIPVHMAGHFCDMQALTTLAAQHNLVVIQDAAHAHGACGADGKPVGAWGSLACFSFQNFKLMTAGEGGAILCPDKETRDRVFLYSNCGRSPTDRSYQHTVVGTNARLNEFSAAVLRSQLQRLGQQTQLRERNAAVLDAALADEIAIRLQGRSSVATVNPHYMYMFTLEAAASGVDRNYLVDCLIAEGVPAFRAYQALYRIPSFWLQSAPQVDQETFIRSCPVTEHVAARGVWIHHRALLGDESDALDVAKAIKKVLRALRSRTSSVVPAAAAVA